MKTNATTTSDRSSSFRRLLQEELARRCAGNPKYSLRAFARYLGLDHATLSQLLRGRRPLTRSTIERLGARLRLDGAAIAAHAASEERALASHGRIAEMQSLARDALRLISDWHHYAILELVRLGSFRPDTRWIARVLDLTPDEVNIALARLVHLGLLEMAAPDRWVDRSGDTVASFEAFGQIAIQRLDEQVRALGQRARASVPAAAQDHSTTTVAVDSRRLPAAIAMIARFRRELLELLESDRERDDVYQLDLHFFPVTTLQRAQENRSWADR